MRVVFMGTPDFAVPSLGALHAAHEVVGVITRPDAVSGRGSRALPSAVKAAALRLLLNVHEFSSLKDPVATALISALRPDVIVVAAYGAILPPSMLALPPLGCINVHASLLPRWRGAAPIQRAILAGDMVTGVSIMRMEEGLDTGPYCAVTRIAVDEKNAAELTGELAEAGAALLLDALGKIESGDCQWNVQNATQATYAEKLTKADVALDPSLTSREFVLRVRASSPAAPARTTVMGRGVTVLVAQESHAVGLPQGGVRMSDAGLELGCVDGAVLVTSVKPDGKSAMPGVAWGRGLRPDPGDQWGSAS